MMSNRLKKDPYADFRSHLVQKALEEKKRMEMEELKEAVYQNSSLQGCSSDTSTTKSGLGSSNRHSWKKIDETSKIDQIQQSLCSSSKEFVPFSSIEKPTDETNLSHLQPSSIPSPPFLLDHIENEDEFLYGKCDSSPVYQTQTSLLDSYNVCQSPLSKKTAGSSGWSDDDDFLPVQSDCLKPDFTYDPKNDITRGLKFSNTTWKKYEQTESSVAGLSKVGLPFDVSEGNCPEFLKSKFGCNQELNKTQLHVSKSEKKNDFFGLIPSSVSASKPSIPDIASLLKNLKQIQMVQSENVQPEACVYAQRIEDLADNLAPQTFTPIKNKITLNLKSKNPSSTNDNQVLQTREDCTNKCQVSNIIINQGVYSNQNTAALLVSQFLQKLSTKQGNREIYQKVKCVTKPLSNTDRGCSDKNSYQSEPYEKESSSSVFDIKKFEINNLQQSSLTRSRKRSISSDSHILECPKKSKVTESFPQKHWSQSDEEQNSEASKHTTNSLKKEGNIKEESIHGILKVKAQDLGCEKNYSENSSDANPARFDRNPGEKSYDRCSRRWSRSPRRRSPGESRRKRSPGESPRKRCRSHKRSSPDRSPKRRSRSCKRSHDRSPRKKFFGRSSRHQSCSRRHQSSDGSTEKGLHGRSSQKESHGNSPRRFLQNNTSVFSLGKNSEIRTEVNTVSKHLLPEDSSNRSLCTESFTVLDQKCDKSLHIPKGKKSILGRDTPPILSVPTPESIRLEGFLRRKDHSEGIKLDTRKKHSVTPPVISSEIEIKLDSLGSAEILPVYHDKDSDDKSVHSQFSKRKTVKKLSKREPICTGLKAIKPTDSVCSSSDDVTCSQPVECGPTQLAPSPALVASDLSSVENYQAAYQPSAYNEVVDPSTYSYYINTLPYTSYSSYGPFSYNMYTSQYPIENHVQQRIGYSDYYTEGLGPHKQIPVINPTATLEEKHISKKALPKKDRRKAVLIQVDSSACDTSNKCEEKMKKKDKNESKTEKGDKSASETEKRDSSEHKIEKRGKSMSEKIEGSGSKIENEKNHHERESKRDKNEDKIDMKGTNEGGTKKRSKSKCKTEKEGKGEDQSKDHGKAPPEGAETSAEEKELLCRKIEIKKQIENLNSEYVRMSKLQGEMMRKMRREKDGHKDYIITAYGRLQDEIKVQLTDLMTAVKDIDKELEKKVETVKCSTPGTEGEFYKKSHMAENIGKGRFVSTMVEVTPENPEFYDPGGHWCQNCNKLTTSVCDMLLHLKSEEHKEIHHSLGHRKKMNFLYSERESKLKTSVQ